MTTREDILSLAVDAMEDAVAGMRYVRQNYGDLSGVGFDRVQQKYMDVINKLAAAPTPPAAEAPRQEPVAWRYKTKGGDWRYQEVEHGQPLYAAPPTYADAEAKGFGKAFLDDLAKGFITLTSGDGDPYIKISYRNLKDAQRGYGLLIDAIRSLASPAPKGET